MFAIGGFGRNDCEMAVKLRPGQPRDLGVDVSHLQGDTRMPQANWDPLAAGGEILSVYQVEGRSR
jgi:hypothetical protein